MDDNFLSMIYMDNREFESPLSCGLGGQSRLMGSCDKATILALQHGPSCWPAQDRKKTRIMFQNYYIQKKLLKYI